MTHGFGLSSRSRRGSRVILRRSTRCLIISQVTRGVQACLEWSLLSLNSSTKVRSRAIERSCTDHVRLILFVPGGYFCCYLKIVLIVKPYEGVFCARRNGCGIWRVVENFPSPLFSRFAGPHNVSLQLLIPVFLSVSSQSSVHQNKVCSLITMSSRIMSDQAWALVLIA